MTVREQLENFYQFASTQAGSSGENLSLDEIYQVWRARNLSPEEQAESVAAVREACADLEAGETGRPARDIMRDACQELGLITEG